MNKLLIILLLLTGCVNSSPVVLANTVTSCGSSFTHMDMMTGTVFTKVYQRDSPLVRVDGYWECDARGGLKTKDE